MVCAVSGCSGPNNLALLGEHVLEDLPRLVQALGAVGERTARHDGQTRGQPDSDPDS